MIVRISAPNFSCILRTTASCSARLRPLPLEPVRLGDVIGSGVPHGTALILTGRPKTPLAVAIARRLASAPRDISITVAEPATVITNSLPSIFHSPFSNIDVSMRWPAFGRALSTVFRKLPRSDDCLGATSCCKSGASDSGRASGVGSATAAEAAAPITTRADDDPTATRGPGSGLDTVESSGFEPPFRAESAANGETVRPDTCSAALRRVSPVSLSPVAVMLDGLPGVRAGAFADAIPRSEEHTSELQSRGHLVCRLLLEKKKKHIVSIRP